MTVSKLRNNVILKLNLMFLWKMPMSKFTLVLFEKKNKYPNIKKIMECLYAWNLLSKGVNLDRKFWFPRLRVRARAGKTLDKLRTGMENWKRDLGKEKDNEFGYLE